MFVDQVVGNTDPAPAKSKTANYGKHSHHDIGTPQPESKL